MSSREEKYIGQFLVKTSDISGYSEEYFLCKCGFMSVLTNYINMSMTIVILYSFLSSKLIEYGSGGSLRMELCRFELAPYEDEIDRRKEVVSINIDK